MSHCVCNITTAAQPVTRAHQQVVPTQALQPYHLERQPIGEPVETAAASVQHLAGPEIEVLLGIIAALNRPVRVVRSALVEAEHENGPVDQVEQATIFLKSRGRERTSREPNLKRARRVDGRNL